MLRSLGRLCWLQAPLGTSLKLNPQQHSLLLITARPFPLTSTCASLVRYDVLPNPGSTWLAQLVFQMTAKVPLHVYKSGVFARAKDVVIVGVGRGATGVGKLCPHQFLSESWDLSNVI